MSRFRRQGVTVSRTVGWLNRLVRRVCLLLIVLAAVGTLLWSTLVGRVDDEIRRLVERKFAEHYPGLRVAIESARRVEQLGIEIRGLSISDPQKPRQPPLLTIPEMFVHCDAEISQLVTGAVEPREITIKRAHVRGTRDAQDRWDIARLWPLPRFGPCRPALVIHGAMCELIEPAEPIPRTLVLRDIDLRLQPPTGAADTGGASGPSLSIVEGTVRCDHCEQIDIRGQIDRVSGGLNVRGAVRGLRVNRRLIGALPSELSRQLIELQSLQGRADFEFQFARTTDQPGPLEFQVSGTLSGGQVEDPRLPHTLRDVHIGFFIDNHQINVPQCTARSDNTMYTVAYRRQGLSSSSPWQAHARIERLMLNDRVARSLPVQIRSAWNRFHPRGLVTLDLALQHDGQRLTPVVQAQCLDVSVTYEQFPYPLDHVRGQIRYADGSLSSEHLVADAGGTELEMAFQFGHRGAHPTGRLVFATNGTLPLDRRLMTALRAIHRPGYAVLHSLNPSGFIRASGRFERTSQSQTLSRNLTIEVVNGSIRYERFPYPLNQISGTLQMIDDRWEFRDLVAFNDSAYVCCSGHWGQADDGQNALQLNFRGTDIPLEDELREALPVRIREVWQKLRPRGTVDHLAVNLGYLPSSKRFTIVVDADKYRRADNVEGRSISVNPVWFPYALNEVSGHLRFADGDVTLQRIQAWHNQAQVSLDGRCEFNSADEWFVHLQNVTASRLVAEDNELLDALPVPLRDGMRKLQLSGPLGLRGEILFAGQPGHPKPAARWNVELDIEDGRAHYGQPLEHIRGGVRLYGSHDQAGLNCQGDLGIDSVLVKGTQLTWLRGPISITDHAVTFGTVGEPARPLEAQQVTANVWKGTLSLDAAISLRDNHPFHVQARLSDADVTELAQDLGSANGNLSGTTTVLLHLQGNAGGVHSWVGDGAVELRDADIYELPLIIALLTPLRDHPLDRTAFNRSHIRYQIRGPHIYFDQIDFSGEALTLKGVGEMDLNRRIDLKFYTLVGRDDVYIPVLRPILGEASRQILMIEMAGTLEQPQVTRKAFPKINDALRQLFPEAMRGEPAPAPAPLIGRRWLPSLGRDSRDQQPQSVR